MTSTQQTAGGWLPRDPAARAAFRARILGLVRAEKAPARLRHSVAAFDRLIGTTPLLRMQLAQAIEQAKFGGHDTGYSDQAEMCAMMNKIIQMPPAFNDTALVGCPLNALFDPIMNYPAGLALFRDKGVNAALQTVLQDWCAFLNGPDSTGHLNTHAPTGWFCPEALSQIDMSLFEHDKSKPHWGFGSWNDYFIRLFKPGKRPIHEPDNPRAIVNACESAPFALQEGVKATDTFWAKDEPYSLSDMLGHHQDEMVAYYEDGTVYQAFLSAHNYHRWNAPVDGTVVHAYNLPGTYYSDSEAKGYDPAGPNLSQGYLSAVAARAVVSIDTGIASLGLVTCIFIGMAEISSNIITVVQGQKVRKGHQLGYFQYGGSTHCLLFQKGAIKKWYVKKPFDFDAAPMHLSSKLALAT